VKLLRRADELMRRYLAGAGTIGLLKIVKGLKMTNRDVCVDFASKIFMYKSNNIRMVNHNLSA
jgi:hypothetical protein